MIKCDQSPLILKLRGKDADWRTTALCLNDTLNVLANYQRREVLTLVSIEKQYPDPHFPCRNFSPGNIAWGDACK